MLNLPELRLAYLLLISAAVLAAAWRVTRRWTGDAVQRGVDAMLLWYAVQYAAVCVPGVLHVLGPGSITIVALLAAGAMGWASRGDAVTPRRLEPGESLVVLGALAFAIGFVVDVCWKQLAVPVIDSDAMTYHVPAALHWLRAGRLSIFPVWFFNPANSFSPLAGSAFIAWMLAPLGGDDVVARVVQAPALVLVFLATVQVARGMGASVTLGALAGVAAVASRPFISEVIAARDDVFLSAFIAVAVGGCSSEAARERFGPWRFGLAVGLAAATKYTFVFAAPLLLLAVDGPWRAGWRWRQWSIVTATVAVVAAPWYLRNLVMTGNPLYPVEVTVLGHRVLPGLFQPLRTARLATLAGANDVLLKTFHGPTPPLTVALLAGWAAALAIGRGAWRNPVLRAAVVGFPACLLLFVVKAPYGEVRFLFPAILLLFPAIAAAVHRWTPWHTGRIILLAALAVLGVRSSFEMSEPVVDVAITSLVAAAVAVGYGVLERGVSAEVRSRLRAYCGLVAIVTFVLMAWVYWGAFVRRYQELGGGPKDREAWERLDPQVRAQFPWLLSYPQFGLAWRYVRDEVPADARIAYANTYLVHPLYGQPPTRDVFYVPVRPDVSDFWHLPKFEKPLPGEEVGPTFSRMLAEKADRGEWVRRLLDSRADYLFVVRSEAVPSPPELAYATSDPARFTPVFADGQASVFKINR